MKTIVISDLHLGIDDKYSETIKNRPLICKFLRKLAKDKSVDELVINGDLFDQWVLPADFCGPEDSDSFYKACAANNKSVMDAFKDLMQAGIKLVYLPGNHDMTLSEKCMNEILPGIVQARETPGLGRYRTGERMETVIEHSHRYELFSAPDILSNKEFVKHGIPMLPPGFFFAKIGMSLLDNKDFSKMPENPIKLKEIEKPDIDSMDYNAYLYYKVWFDVISSMFPAEKDIKEKFVKIRVDGFVGDFSVEDVLPAKQGEGIYAKLYKNIESRWDEIQKINDVKKPSDFRYHVEHIIDQNERYKLPKEQYFDLDEGVDCVVFGHSHLPAIVEYEGFDKPKIFVNDGAWLDNNTTSEGLSATFAYIESEAGKTKAKVMKCVENGEDAAFVDISNDVKKQL